MNKDILNLGKDLKRVIGTRVAPAALAGSLLFSGGLLTEASAFSFEEPTIGYKEFSEYNGVKIFINGRFVEFNDFMGYPTIINDTTYIPVRVVSEAFNAYVYYSGELERVYINKHGSQMIIYLKSGKIEFIKDLDNPDDRKEITTGAKTITINDRTYLPLRVIFEAFGSNVEWREKDTTVIVTDNYEENSKYIDFKEEKVLEIKDIDLEKDYDSIIYDGQVIAKDYVKLLSSVNQYKVIESNGNLYIFSYQYLMDLNYLYEAHVSRKSNLSDDETDYELWSISEDEIEYLKSIAFIDGYHASYLTRTDNMTLSGKVYYLVSHGDKDEYEKVDEIVDKIVEEVRATTDNSEEMVRLVTNKLCDLIAIKKIIPGEWINIPSVYNALINGYGVCQDYSITFKYVMDKLGIPCVVVSGGVSWSVRGHAWNEVYIDGEWKVIDVSNYDSTKNEKYLLFDLDSELYNKNYFVKEKYQFDMDIVKLTLKLDKTEF